MNKTNFLYKSNIIRKNILNLCDNLLQSAPDTNVTSIVKNIIIILDRFSEYLKFSDYAEFNTSVIETINVLDVVSVGLKSANNAAHKKGNRMILNIVSSNKGGIESCTPVFEMPHCLPIMKQALFQIVDNAVKYSPENSKLDIKIEGNYCFDGDSDRTAITFTNIGPKVYDYELDDECNDIFCKSIRGENAEFLKPDSGLGLGLTLVDMIIQCHKWIDAKVFADSGDVEFRYNNIEYAPFSITIHFSNKCSDIKDVASDLKNLQEVIEKMSKHELAGSMPELTRLAYEVAIQSINSSVIAESAKRLAFDLMDKIIDFVFYLNEEGVSGRPIEIRNDGTTDKMLDRFVRWAYVYRKGEKPPRNLWERVEPFSTITICNSFIVAAWLLVKYAVDNGLNIILRSENTQFEINSEKEYPINFYQIEVLKKLFIEENKLSLQIKSNRILIKKIK